MLTQNNRDRLDSIRSEMVRLENQYKQTRNPHTLERFNALAEEGTRLVNQTARMIAKAYGLKPRFITVEKFKGSFRANLVATSE